MPRSKVHTVANEQGAVDLADEIYFPPLPVFNTYRDADTHQQRSGARSFQKAD